MIVPSNNDVRAFAKMATSTSARDTSFFRVNINGDTELNAPRYILSRSIESNTSASSSMGVTFPSASNGFGLYFDNLL
jgi:hypothetical protein